MTLNRKLLEKKYTDLNEIDEINLSLTKLQDIDQDTFRGLSNLTEIDLSWNLLDRLNSQTFSGVDRLAKLYLYSNQLVLIDNDSFQGLSNLVEIDLSWNRLERIDKQAFHGLYKLVLIYLNCNHLTHLDQVTFNDLNDLELLYLYNNHLTKIEKHLFKNLINLKEIYLSSNRLVHIDGATFNGLINLVKLDLSCNLLNDIHKEAFNSLISLKEIDLSQNKLQSIDKYSFRGLKKLVKICLHKNLLVKIEKNPFKNLIAHSAQNEILQLHIEDSVKFVSFSNDSTKNNINLITKQKLLRSISLGSTTVIDKLTNFFKPNQIVHSVSVATSQDTYECEEKETSSDWEIDFPQRILTRRNSIGSDVFGSKYIKVNFLGGGAFGKVWQVKNIELSINKFYAMKEIMIRKEMKQSFVNSEIIREAELLKRLRACPYIIEYEDCFIDSTSDFFFIVTEFCAEGDLEKQIKIKKQSNEQFGHELTYQWSKEIILGLDFLHENKIIHRDVKPANIFLQNGHLKLGDLGEAKCILVSVADTFKGTFRYMSPEMIATEDEKLNYTTKTDIWAAGVIIYELITLKYPFKESSNLILVIESIKNDEINPFQNNESPQMKDLVKMMLEKDQNARADSKILLDFLIRVK